MNKFAAACIISKISWSPADLQNVRAFLSVIVSSPDAEMDFFNYCNQWKLASWVFTQLNRQGLFHLLSEPARERFRQTHEKIKNENEKRNHEALRFLTAFKENDIDVIILKGNLFAQTVYKDTGYKRMNDFDILIRMEDWDKIQNIYFSLGYIPLGFGWSGEKQKAAKFSHVGMSFISTDFSCIIGSQWGLKSPTTSFIIDIEDAWRTARNFVFFGVQVKQLSPEYNVLHLILHMGIFKCGIRDCMDIYNYLLSEKIDEQHFFELIRQANAIDKTWFTFSLSNICSGTLNTLIKKMKPAQNSFITKRLATRMLVYKVTGDFQDSYNDYFQDIEKAVIYFNLFPLFHKKLARYLVILKLIFFPKKITALKLSDYTYCHDIRSLIKSRLKAPYYVFSLIALEIGWKFTFLLFFKLGVDLVVSLKNYVVKKESYFDYLEKKGIDPKSIENAVKNIQ